MTGRVRWPLPYGAPTRPSKTSTGCGLTLGRTSSRDWKSSETLSSRTVHLNWAEISFGGPAGGIVEHREHQEEQRDDELRLHGFRLELRNGRPQSPQTRVSCAVAGSNSWKTGVPVSLGLARSERPEAVHKLFWSVSKVERSRA